MTATEAAGTGRGRAQDLRGFLAALRSAHAGEVLTVEEEVEGEALAALVAELASRGRDEVLLCPRVKGAGATVVTNVFASRRRIARLLGTGPAGLHGAYHEAAARAVEPRVVPDGPVLQAVREGAAVDLTDPAQLPVLRHFASDRAPYITGGVVAVEAPPYAPGRAGNLSFHRALVHSRTELATSLHSRGHLWQLLRMAEERGERLPVAMVIGAHPLFLLAASARVGPGTDERDIAGGLFGAPLDVVRTPRYGIRVPAGAEIVLEGAIDPGRHADEGPFGEFSGYSSHRSTRNVLTVETVLRRRDALLLDVTGGNSADHLNLARVPREADGLATAVAGTLNSFPSTVYSQNIGLIQLTGVKSRWIVAAGGGIMMVLGLMPKVGAAVAAMPASVLGGATLVLFSSIAVVGVQILGRADLSDHRNTVLVAASLGIGFLPTAFPQFAERMPGRHLHVLFESGIILGTLAAVLLNLFFHHLPLPGGGKKPDGSVDPPEHYMQHVGNSGELTGQGHEAGGNARP
ncbi:solute carrier family 23 protein [Streptomyces sp. NPDC006134]|uniref:solute carrier family 23 protein n=1 Tax=Streptomyces sp. NPDC006134 TaxID=3154467 RepID=UPI0033C8D915